MNKTVVALYDELSAARSVVQELVDAGFERDSISLVANAGAQEYERYFDKAGRFRADTAEEVTATEAGEGAGIGAVIGGLGGVLMGFGLLAIPGVGPALAAGPLISGLLGVGAGAVVGGLVGALIKSGVPQDVANNYTEAIRRGGSLVSIIMDESRAAEAETIMNRHSPIDLEERVASWREEEMQGEETHKPTHEVRETVRHTEVNVENLDGDVTHDYHEHYSAAFGALGRRYEDYEPAYRFGRRLAEKRGADSDWKKVELEARRDWEADHPGTWEEFRDAIHYSFDRKNPDA